MFPHITEKLKMLWKMSKVLEKLAICMDENNIFFIADSAIFLNFYFFLNIVCRPCYFYNHHTFSSLSHSSYKPGRVKDIVYFLRGAWSSPMHLFQLLHMQHRGQCNTLRGKCYLLTSYAWACSLTWLACISIIDRGERMPLLPPWENKPVLLSWDPGHRHL